MIIKSAKSLCADYLGISRLAHDTSEPIYITLEGEGDLVLMSIESFEKHEESIKAKLMLNIANESIANSIKRRDNMAETELGNILSNMYTNAPKGDQVAFIHLFGIRYADVLERERLDKKAILRVAGLPESYQTEISKGIKLAKYVEIKSGFTV